MKAVYIVLVGVFFSACGGTERADLGAAAQEADTPDPSKSMDAPKEDAVSKDLPVNGADATDQGASNQESTIVTANAFVRTIHHPANGTATGKGIIATDEHIQEVVVLDATEKRAALKIVSHPGEGSEGLQLKDCKYPGVEKEPGTSVVLALVEMESQRVEEWHVYPSPPVYDGTCVSFEQSKATLETAKAAMKQAGLDIERKPTMRPIPPEGLNAGGRTYTVKSEMGRSADSALFREVYGSDEGEAMMEGVSQLEVLVDGVSRYRVRDTFGTAMAGQMEIRPFKAIETAKGVVFVLQHSYTSGRGNGTGFSVTPAL